MGVTFSNEPKELRAGDPQQGEKTQPHEIDWQKCLSTQAEHATQLRDSAPAAVSKVNELANAIAQQGQPVADVRLCVAKALAFLMSDHGRAKLQELLQRHAIAKGRYVELLNDENGGFTRPSCRGRNR